MMQSELSAITVLIHVIYEMKIVQSLECVCQGFYQRAASC